METKRERRKRISTKVGKEKKKFQLRSLVGIKNDAHTPYYWS